MCSYADVEFNEGETEHFVEVEVLFDGAREMREAFTIHLKPDENMVAEIQVQYSDVCLFVTPWSIWIRHLYALNISTGSTSIWLYKLMVTMLPV